MREFLLGLLLVYFLPFVGLVFVGIAEVRHPMVSECNSKWARYEYVFPAYRIGCWLGE